MSESTKKLLIDLGIGFAGAVAAAFLFDLFGAETLSDTLRILSDCFFLSAVIMLASGGLTLTKNGGVWDGLGFTFKTAIGRMKRDYDTERVTFAQYRQEREGKNTSPASALIAGSIYLALALAFLAAYNFTL